MDSILIASRKFAKNKLFMFQSENETQRIKNKIKNLLFFQVCPMSLMLANSETK
jgi:hypothetical protein